jgi:hypothetical protein
MKRLGYPVTQYLGCFDVKPQTRVEQYPGVGDPAVSPAATWPAASKSVGPCS